MYSEVQTLRDVLIKIQEKVSFTEGLTIKGLSVTLVVTDVRYLRGEAVFVRLGSIRAVNFLSLGDM
jgi:hypothetical protein